MLSIQYELLNTKSTKNDAFEQNICNYAYVAQ